MSNSCAGVSAAAGRGCAAPVVYAITIGGITRHTCGRHLAWWLGRVLLRGGHGQPAEVRAV